MTGNPRRTNVRWRVVGAVFLLAFITIIDRVGISSAKSKMAADLNITDIQFGWVFGAFTLGYAVLMVPAGAWADRIGPRRFLTIIVCCWSLLTASTGLVAGLAPLICIRFLFGLAEAGSYPTASRALYSWMSTSERGSALGLLNTGSRLGAALGLAIASYTVLWLGWRTCFWILGIVGLAWAFWWYRWYRDDPAQNGDVSIEELDYIRQFNLGTDTPTRKVTPRWESIVFSFSGCLLLFQYFANNFSLFLVYSWMLPYLQQRFQMPLVRAGIYAGLPMYCGVIATWTGGVIVDFLFSRGYQTWSRVLPAIVGFALASVSVALSGFATTPLWFVFWFGLVVFGLDLTISSSWTLSADYGGEHTGAVSGAMNMMGAIGSFTSSLAFPYMLRFTGHLEVFFCLAAALNTGAVICWLMLARSEMKTGQRS